MALSQAQKSDFVSEVRQKAGTIIGEMNDLRTLVDRYNAGGYGAAVVDEDFGTDADQIGHAGKTAAEFQAAITTFGALLATYDAGHDTNLEVFRA